MAEPRIQYAKTSDGVSIAYATLGEGEPHVLWRVHRHTGVAQFPSARVVAAWRPPCFGDNGLPGEPQ